MREAWPFIVLNTALRRLGCGGRAALGNEFPVPAVRRKFYELYRITPPKTATDETPTGSPPASPTHSQGHYPSLSSSTASAMTNGSTASGLGQPTAEQVASNPVLLNIVELVKLLQASLALWGMYGTAHEEVEIDGLFCDETKAGMFAWRRLMGMESDDGFKLAVRPAQSCKLTTERDIRWLYRSAYTVRAIKLSHVGPVPACFPRRGKGQFLMIMLLTCSSPKTHLPMSDNFSRSGERIRWVMLSHI